MTQAREIAELGTYLTVNAGTVTVGNSSTTGAISVANSGGTFSTGSYLISNGNATNAATIDIALPVGFRTYKLILGPGFVPNTASALLAMRVSYDNGSTFQNTNYSWGMIYTSSAAAAATGGFSCNDTSTWQTTAFVLSAYGQNTSQTGASSYEIDITQGVGTSFIPTVSYRSWILNAAGSVNGYSTGGGNHNTADVYDSIRILPNTGGVNGRWALYGSV